MSKLKLSIHGLASGRNIKSWEFSAKDPSLELDLLSFLRQEKVPIASSCFGEGVCQKCVFNGNQLACQIKLRELFSQKNKAIIQISYL